MLYVARGCGRLFLAKYEGDIIGGLICVMFGRKCVAMHMGTPYQYQKLQSYYAYVWESIRWAKENGCEWYSFRGVGYDTDAGGVQAQVQPEGCRARRLLRLSLPAVAVSPVLLV